MFEEKSESIYAMKAIIIEDEVTVADDLEEKLKKLGHSVPAIATSRKQALLLVDEHQPNLIFVDVVLENTDAGIEIARELKRRHQDIPFVFISSQIDSALMAQARQTQPDGFLVQPISKDDLYVVTEMALLHAEQQREKDRQRANDMRRAEKGEAVSAGHLASEELRDIVNHREDRRTRDRSRTGENGGSASEQLVVEPAGDGANGLPPFRLRKIKQYISENLDEEICLEELAELSGSSKYHFCHLFKESMGVSPYRFVMEQRIDRAKHLLAGRDIPITRIAYRIGFNSPSHFSKTFRKHVGTTPSAFRKKREAGSMA